ncbi:MAG: hypothetical protein CMJ83_22125 [Planctomycetes bacterium]|nr:hypothetical protein [Planctomycetota bacterium]
MNVRFEKTLAIALGVILVGVNLILLNVLVERAGVRVRVDLTEGQRYTLSDVTKDFLTNLERPAELIFFYSSPKSMPPVVKPLLDPLRDALSEFAVVSDGNVKTRFVELDTAGKKAQEEAKKKYGVESMQIPVVTAYEDTIKNVYFSVIISCGDQIEHIPLVPSPLVRIVQDRSTFGVKLELNDTEFVIAKALRKVSGNFNSVAGALVGREVTAKLTCYLSAKEKLPEYLGNIGDTVKKVADELADDAPGRVTLDVVDPLAGMETRETQISAMRQLMQATGVRPIRGRDDDFYSWLLLDVDGQKEAIALLPRGKAEIGQADIKDMVEGSLKRLVPGFLPTVGIISPTPPPAGNPMMRQQRPQDPFSMTREALSAEFQVKTVSLASGPVPRDVGILLVLRPGDLPDSELYALDQFIMRGGRIVICGGGFHMDMQAMQRSGDIALAPEGGTRLREWLRHYGIEVRPELLLDSRCSVLAYPETETDGFMTRIVGIINIKYPFFLRMDRAGGLDDEHPVTAFLQNASLFWASPVELTNVPDGAEGSVLLRTTGEASTTRSTNLISSIMEVSYEPGTGPLGRVGSIIRTVFDKVDRAVERDTPFPPANLRDQIGWMLDIRTHQYTTAVAVKGSFVSYFADRAIPGTEEAPQDDPNKPKDGGADPKPGETPKDPRKQTAPLEKSRRPGSIVVIGDSDFASHLSYRPFGLDEAAIRENLRLLTSAVEWSSDDEFAAIRNRRAQSRPLTGLAGLDPEVRDRKSRDATIMTFIVTVGVVFVFALLWIIYRKTRQPLTLVETDDVTGELA